LKSQAEALGVASQVEFLGQRQDTGDLLSACDLFVTPSREEGLGVAALEAMAAGRAVVATAVGGLRDAVVDGVTGMLVPPEEPRALAMSIGRLLRDDELRRRFGRAGPAHIAEGFLPEQMVTAHEQLYEAVMREWHAGRRAC
jgi:glycosyltransferase involved in cell wall biosynthesis